MNRIFLSVLACLVLAVALLTATPAGAQLQPSSDVLLPYFEVNLQKASASNTLLDVGNALDKPVNIEITIYTNWNIQIAKVNLTLAAHQLRSFDLRSWLAGELPGKKMTSAEMNHFKAALTGLRSPKDNLFYASPVGPGIAVGSVRIKTIGKPQPDALWGTYFLIDSDQSSGEGDTLVNLDPGTGCIGGCKRHALRFLTAGNFDGGTQIVVWTDVAAKPSSTAKPASYVQADTLAYDEAGQPLGGNRLRLLPLQVVSVSDLGLRQPSGSIDLQTQEMSVVAVHYSSKNRFGVGLMSYCLPLIFGPGDPGLHIVKRTNGEDANTAPGPSIKVGQPVLWEYIVENTGDSVLTNVQVSDSKGVSVSCPKVELDPGEQMTCTGHGTAEACQYENIGTVTGQKSSTGEVLSADDPSHYFGDQDADIAVELLVNGDEADAPTGPTVDAGSQINWSFVVTNTGEVALNDIKVGDSQSSAVSCPKTGLRPGESMTCTAGGSAAKGQIKNVATVSGKWSCYEVHNEDPGHYFGRDTPAPPGISIKKLTNNDDCQAAPGKNISAGSQVRWDFVVTNTGKVRLESIQVTDDKEGAVSCPKSSLQPGESMTCSKTGVAKACQYSNVGSVTATSSGGTVSSDSDQSWYFGQTSPAVKVKAYTNGQDADTPTGPEILAGSPVQWTYTVTNTGTVALREVKVTDDHGASVSCPKASLQPGESMTCSASGAAGEGQYKNVGTVTGTADTLCGGNVSASDPSHYYGKPQPPGISLKKLTNGDDIQAAPGQSIPVGNQVRWDYIVTNTGQVRLDSIKVTDDKEGAVSCPKSSLQPGESMTCSKTGVAKACQYTNVGTVTATSSGGTVSSASDSSWYFGQTSPALKVKTYTNGQDADTPTGPEVLVGNAVQWTYTVTNSGNVALREVKVTDDRGASVSCPKTSLQPGESMTCSASSVAVQGQYKNIGTVTGTADTSCGGNASASDPSHYYGKATQPPSIAIKKLTNNDDCHGGSGKNITVGGSVRWDYIVTNTGNVRLDNIQVTDDKEGPVSCPKSSLQPGESMTCSKTGVAKACQYSNVGTVTAKSPTGAAATASDTSAYFGQTNPAVKVKTYTNSQDADTPTGPEIAVGSPVQWTYTVTNSGNVALRDVKVSDDRLGNVTCPKTSLQPGESMTCSASGTAVQGQYKNIGTVTGTADTSCGGNASASDPSHYYGKVTQPPSIAIKKLTNNDDCHGGSGKNISVGSSVRWDYIVTNTGNVRLDNIQVTDDKEGAVSCPKSSLQAGEWMTCSKTGVAKACQYSNVGTVTAKSPTGAAATASGTSAYFGQTNPALQVKTYTNGQDADTGTGPTIPAGSPVQWTYTVTNKGNVALRDVKVTDDRKGAISCPKASLQPGESMTCSASGVATEGQYTNIGTVNGTADTSCGGSVSASDPSRYLGTGANHPPQCNGKPSNTWLWPNYKMENINILGVTDPDQDSVTVKITSITQDEPVNEKSGSSETDGAGVGSSVAQIRAERNGSGDGRVYVIGFTAQDSKGASCSGTVSVGVPRDQRAAVDSGQLYNSTIP